MSEPKLRVTVTVDPEYVQVAKRAVAEGATESVSSWVNEALRAQVERDHKLSALAEAVADYEAEHGEISVEEMAEQARHEGNPRATSHSGTQRGVA